MNLFLEQTSTVQTLIDNVVKSLAYIQDNEAKDRLIKSLEPFYYSTALTTIDVNEIKLMAKEYKISLTHAEALKILDNIRFDLDLNSVRDCIKYHFNEFIDKQV